MNELTTMSVDPRKYLVDLLNTTSLKAINKNVGIVNNHLPLWYELEEIAESGIWYWDFKNNILYWSDGYFKMLNAKEGSSYSVLELYKNVNIHPDDIDPLCEAIYKVIKNKKSVTFEYRCIRDDGSIRYLKTRMSTQLDQNKDIIFIVGLEVDVSVTHNAIHEFKVYKESVTANEIFLKMGTWEYNLKTKKITLSESLRKLLKYPCDHNKDLTLNEWANYHMYSYEQSKFAQIYLNLRRKDVDVIDRLNLKKFCGDEIIVRLMFRVMRNDRGLPIKILGTLKDVSELENSERKLELMVEELNRSNRELEEFAYIASHDLQEPIRKLITFSERINSLFAKDIPSSANVYLEKISKAAFNMKHLIENLLEFSRVTRTKSTFERTSLKSIVDSVIQDYELQIEETNAKVTCSDLPEADVVPYQMQQLFVNLMGNAMKFRKKDVTPEINISHRLLYPQEIKERNLNPKSNYLMIEFSDNGIGFEQEYEEKVFQVFQRLNGKSEYPGTGIGLSICRKVVGFHNGIINLKSEIGVGTTFYIILPCEQKNIRV